MSLEHDPHPREQAVGTQAEPSDLLRQNEALRHLGASLAEEKLSLEKEKVLLQTQVMALREELECERRRGTALQDRLRESEEEGRRLGAHYVSAETRNNRLVRLYVAIHRLHESLDRAAVLGAVEEILLNLIGCEEFGIFELGTSGQELRLVSWCGISPRRYAKVRLGHGTIGGCAATAETFVADPRDVHDPLAEGDTVTACVPLRVGAKVIGVVAVFGLLRHKAGRLTQLDHEVLELIATHGATALHRCRGEAGNPSP